jgi:hypothetical protein
MSRPYHLVKSLPSEEDPPYLMARPARSGLFDEYVVHEDGSRWSFADGALASVRVHRSPRGTAWTRGR